jgi:hypothetical protein
VAIFRRFDFWVVTGFVTLGAVYVLVTQQLHRRLKAPAEVVQVVLDPIAPPSTQDKRPGAAAPVLPFQVEKTAWTSQANGHWLLELRIRYRNEAEELAQLSDPKAGVQTGAGEPVEPFFLAIAAPPEVAAHREETVELRYWVRPEQAKGELWLQVDGKRARVEAPPAAAAL